LTLGATTLLHEADLDLSSRGVAFPDENRFFADAARAMRGLIVDHVRERRTIKRGGQFHLTALDGLAVAEPALAELVELKFFCGFGFAEIAAMRGVSERTVQPGTRCGCSCGASSTTRRESSGDWRVCNGVCDVDGKPLDPSPDDHVPRSRHSPAPRRLRRRARDCARRHLRRLRDRRRCPRRRARDGGRRLGRRRVRTRSVPLTNAGASE
jgi:hypothetical protein